MAAEINGIKPDFTLMDHNFINYVAYLLTDAMQGDHAKDHYQDNDIPPAVHQGKLWRHYVDILNGKTDDKSGLDPEIHMAADCMILWSQKQRRKAKSLPQSLSDYIRNNMREVK